MSTRFHHPRRTLDLAAQVRKKFSPWHVSMLLARATMLRKKSPVMPEVFFSGRTPTTAVSSVHVVSELMTVRVVTVASSGLLVAVLRPRPNSSAAVVALSCRSSSSSQMLRQESTASKMKEWGSRKAGPQHFHYNTDRHSMAGGRQATPQGPSWAAPCTGLSQSRPVGAGWRSHTALMRQPQVRRMEVFSYLECAMARTSD